MNISAKLLFLVRSFYELKNGRERERKRPKER